MTAVGVAAAVGSGIMAGFYLAFSALVMPGLRRTAAGGAVTAMQRMNEHAPAAWVPVALTTAVLSIVLAVSGVGALGTVAGLLDVAGAVAYLASVAITIAYHVPRNERLAALDPDDGGSAAYWATFLTEWTRMNHVRTATCAVAAACFAAAVAR